MEQECLLPVRESSAGHRIPPNSRTLRHGRDDPEPVLLPLQQNEYRVIQFCVAMRDTKPDHLGFTKPDHLLFAIIVGKTSKTYKKRIVLQFCFLVTVYNIDTPLAANAATKPDHPKPGHPALLRIASLPSIRVFGLPVFQFTVFFLIL